MKMEKYPKTEKLNDEDILVAGTSEGTKTISAKDLKNQFGGGSSGDDYLPTKGGTMEGNIDMNGHKIKSDIYEIDFPKTTESSYKWEIGVRNPETKEWISKITLDREGLMSLLNGTTKIDVDRESIQMISDGRILLKPFEGTNASYISMKEDALEIGMQSHGVRVKKNGEVKLYGDGNAEICITSAGEIHIKGRNTVDNAVNGMIITDAHIRLVAELRTYLDIPFRDGGENMTINAWHKKLTIKSEQYPIKICSPDNIELLPGYNSEHQSPGPDNHIKSGNIQGRRFLNGNKPSISNFSQYTASGAFYNHEEDVLYNWNCRLGTVEAEAEADIPTLLEIFADADYKYNGYHSNSKILLSGDGSLNIFSEHSDNSKKMFKLSTFNSAEVAMYLSLYSSRSDYIGIRFYGYGTNNAIVPYQDNKSDLGGSYYRWKDIYATNGVIQTSDVNAKKDIERLSVEKAKELILAIEPTTYKMKDGTSGRTHWGMLSNNLVNEDGEIKILGIEGVLDKLGWETEDFAGFIKSPHYDIEEYEEMETYYEEEEDGETKTRKVPKTRTVKKTREVLDPNKHDYALRPQEFLPGVIALVQDHEARINKYEDIIKNQNEEIVQLRNEVDVLKDQVKELLARLSY